MPRQLALFGGGKQLMGSPRKLAPFERILELDRAALKLVREQGWSVPDAYRAAMAADAFADAGREPAPKLTAPRRHAS